MKQKMSPGQLKELLLNCIASLSSDPDLVRQIVKEPGKNFTRNRKWTLPDILQFILFMESKSLPKERKRYFDFQRGPELPSLSAFFMQRNKLKPNAFEVLFHMFMDHIQPVLYKNKYILTAVDGSTFDIFYNPNDPSTFATNSDNKRGFNQIHVTASYRLEDRVYTDAVIQPLHAKDEHAAFVSIIDRAPKAKGTYLYIGDRNFFSYNVAAHAIKNNASFLIRAKRSFCESLLGEELPSDPEFDVTVHRILVRHKRTKKYQHPEALDSYRYIDKNGTFDFLKYGESEEYPIDLRIVRVKIPKNADDEGENAEEGDHDDENAAYEYLITNLPAKEFSKEDLCNLYHRRWGIETSFRDLKYAIGAVDFHSKSASHVTHEVWSRLIIYNFTSKMISLAYIKVPSNDKYDYRVNFSDSADTCHEYLIRRDYAPPIDVLGLIRDSIALLPRKSRNFERRKRSRTPLTFVWRH